MTKQESPDTYINELRQTLTELTQKEAWIANDILKLKNVAQGINAHVTYLMGIEFLKCLDIEASDAHFEYQKMYDNGFDMEFETNGHKIVAEIKGNNPVNTNSYGAQQKKGIKTDIDHLINGKKKKTDYKTKDSLAGVYRFLILLDSNKEAIEKLIYNMKDNDGCIIWGEKSLTQCVLEDFSLDAINIVFVTL